MNEEPVREINRLADEEGYLHRSEVLPIIERAVGAAEQAGYTEGFHDALHNTTPKHSEQRKGALARTLNTAVQAEQGKLLYTESDIRAALTLFAHLLWKAFHPQRLDMPCYIFSHG